MCRSHWSVSGSMSDTDESNIGLTDYISALSTRAEFTRSRPQLILWQL